MIQSNKERCPSRLWDGSENAASKGNYPMVMNVSFIDPALPKVFGTVVLAVCSITASAGSFVVSDDGSPRAAIVIGEKPVKAARFAAAELQHVLKLVTGAELPITAERPAEGSAFYVGCAAGGDVSVRGAPFTKEEYLVAFRGNDCYLCGHDDEDYGTFDYADDRTFPAGIYCYRSTTYAVYDFLEKHCGVRFYGFGDDGIAFDPRPTLRIASVADVRRAPAMDAYRRPYFGSRAKTQLGVTPRDEKLLQLRWRANCMFGEVNHSVMGIWYRHYAPSKVASRAKLFKGARPDWFAQGYKGKNAPNCLRRWDYPGDVDIPPQLCTSSEGPVGYFADEAVRVAAGEKIECSYANRPVMAGQPFYYPVQEQDSGAWCKCDRCRKNPRLKNYLYRHFDWVNRIARAVKAKNPSVGIGTLAYGDTLAYPEGLDLEDNVLVQMCIGPQSWFHPYTKAEQLKRYDRWVEMEGGRRPLTVWLYFLCPWSEAHAVHKYGNFFPIYYPRHTGKFFKKFGADGIRGFFAEITPRYHLLEAYVAAKLADDPSLDPDALIDEHYALYYGAAGAAMKRFGDVFEAESYDIANYSDRVKAMRIVGSYIYRFHSERDNWHLGSAERVKRLDRLMDAAKAAAKTPSEKARVRDFCTRIWNTAVDGRKEYEERERVRAIPIPYVASGGRTSAFRTLDNKDHPVSSAMRVSNDSKFLRLEYAERGGDAASHPELNLWMNGLEIFLATTRDSDYLQFAVSPTGEVKAHRSVVVEGAQRIEPVTDIVARSRCTAEGWKVCVDVPFSAIPRDARAGEYLYGNFFRTRRWEGGVSTVWSPIFCERYLAGLHRFGTIFTVGEIPHGEVAVRPADWSHQDTKGGLKPGEAFSFADGILKIKGGDAKAPFYVFQSRPFYAVRPGCRVMFEFDASGTGAISACLPQLVGRAYFAGLVQKRVTLSPETKRYRLALDVAKFGQYGPPTTTRLGFGVFDGASAEIANLKVSFESASGER